MAKRVMLDEKQAEKARKGMLVVAKGKERRRAIEHDRELENTALAPVRKEHREVRSSIEGKTLAAIVNESLWRTQHEIFPAMGTSENVRLNSDEFFSYNIRLGMLFGPPGDSKRQGLKMKEHSYSDPPQCKEH